MLKSLMTGIFSSVSVAVAATAFSLTALAEDANLTPMGSPIEGDGDRIPRWEGGLTEPPEGYKSGDYYIDPFSSDKPIFVVNSKNVDKFKQYLSEGQLQLLERYPEYEFPAYVSRRTAAYSDSVYKSLKYNAENAELLPRGTGVKQSKQTSPFIQPQSGEEMIWNHILRYRGSTQEATLTDAVVYESGASKVMRREIKIFGVYFDENIPENKRKNKIFMRKSKNLYPPSIAGQMTLVHETLDQVLAPRKAWYYAPGQRRVRRTPDLEYADELFNSDGYKTVDQVDMYNGAPDLYEWKIIGKTTKLIPYNSYRMTGAHVTTDQLLGERTLNPEYTRYELHRVWHLEATLRAGIKHQYVKRVFYIDEDSWQIALAEEYGAESDKIWRYSEAHAINFYDVPMVWSAGSLTYDLLKGGYYAEWLITADDKPHVFNKKMRKRDFKSSVMRREGTR